MNKLWGRTGEKSKHQTSTRFSRNWRMEHTCRTKGNQLNWTDSRQRPFSRDQFRIRQDAHSEGKRPVGYSRRNASVCIVTTVKRVAAFRDVTPCVSGRFQTFQRNL